MTSAKAKTIVINPVSRIEAHGKVTIHLDEEGEVIDQIKTGQAAATGFPPERCPDSPPRIPW